MKERFENAELELLLFGASDVIATSGGGGSLGGDGYQDLGEGDTGEE